MEMICLGQGGLCSLSASSSYFKKYIYGTVTSATVIFFELTPTNTDLHRSYDIVYSYTRIKQTDFHNITEMINW